MRRHLAALVFLVWSPLGLAQEVAEVEALVCRLGSESWEDREAAHRALRELGPDVLPLLESIRPADPEVESRLAMLVDWLTFGRHGPFADSIRALEARLAAKPKDHGARRDLGWSYLVDVGEPDRAAAHFRILAASRARASLRASAVHGLAEIERRRGDLDEAVRLHQEGLAIQPTCSGWHALAWIHDLEQRDVDGAIDACRKALAIRTTFDYGKLSLAVFLAEKGEREEAARLVDEVYRAPPVRHLNLARYHAVIGEPDRALEYLASYLDRPGTVEAVRERARIEIAADHHFEGLRAHPRFQELAGTGGDR